MLPPGTIIANTGLLRMGKTMNATRLAYLEYLEGARVYTNYDTSFSERIDSMPQLFAITQGVVVLDELQATLDSREFSKNVGLTHWLTLIGKMGLSLIYTAQSFGMVDIRVRQLTGWLYAAEKKIYPGGNPTTVLALYAVAPTGMAFLRRRLLMPHEPLYPLYDTLDTKVVLGKELNDRAFSPMARFQHNDSIVVRKARDEPPSNNGKTKASLY